MKGAFKEAKFLQNFARIWLLKCKEGRKRAPSKSLQFQIHSVSFRRVEFRYDLGSGPGVIRTHKKISLGRWHRIQARTNAVVAAVLPKSHSESTPSVGRSPAHLVNFFFTKTLIVPSRSDPAHPPVQPSSPNGWQQPFSYFVALRAPPPNKLCFFSAR